MRPILSPLSLIITSIAGWINQCQQHAIEYLVEENRVLREQLGNCRFDLPTISADDLPFAPRKSVGALWRTFAQSSRRKLFWHGIGG